jgi:signal transduction histidine kinase
MSVLSALGRSAPGDEAAVLRRCLADVVALSGLPAKWAGADEQTVADDLALVLDQILGTDLVYVGFRASASRPAVYATCTNRSPLGDAACASVVSSVTDWLAFPEHGATAPTLPTTPCSLFSTPIGVFGDYGIIVLGSARPEFPRDTDRLLVSLAANVSVTVLLGQRTQHEYQRAESALAVARDEQRISDTLQRIGAQFAAERDVERLLQAATDEATALTGAEFGAFFYNVVNPAGESYMLYTLAGAPRDAFARFPMPRNTPIFAPTFAGGRVVRLDDVTKDASYGTMPPHYGMPQGHLPVCSYLAVPVRSRSGFVYGGLFFGHHSPAVFTERHERMAIGIAGWAALALDNANLLRQAQEANTAKDHFLATVSHELRTPLNALLGWLSMLGGDHVLTPEAQPRAFETITRNARALAQLVDDLLDISRIATGKIQLAFDSVDVRDLVTGGARMIQPELQAKGIQLSVDLDPSPCMMRGDAGRLQQVVWNLLNNAAKFTSTGGQIRVLLTCQPPDIVLTVTDTGIGIPPDFMPYVFEQFRQGHQLGTSGGLGLGLAIARNIIELHGGHIGARSDGVGRGATFTVTLPASGVTDP